MSLDNVTSPSTGGKPPFADARQAKEWLKLLPLINTQQSLLELTDTLTQLNQSRIDALELLKCLELLREAVHTTQEGELVQYTSKTLPLAATELQHWKASLQLWELLETAYARCWRAVRDGHAGVAEHHALIAQRTLRYGGYAARTYHLIYRPVPNDIWQRLFSRYQLTEASHIARLSVRDSLIDIHGTSSAQTMLIHALLLNASDPRKLTSKQILWLDQRLELLASRTSLAPQSPALPGKTPLQIDLAAPAPALRATLSLSGDSVREIDTLILAQVLSKRIKLLREGELPQKLGLGTSIAPQAAETLLTDLYRRWCELPTLPPLPRRAEIRHATIGMGIMNLYLLVSNDKVTLPPENGPQMDQRALEEIKLYGRVKAHLHQPTQRPGNSEQWEVVRELPQEYQLLRPASYPARIGLQQLIGINTAGQYQLGMVRSLEESEGQMQIGVRLLSGEPQGIFARPQDLTRIGQGQFNEILLLHAVAEQKSPPTLILPLGWYRQGRLLDIWDGVRGYRVRLVQTMERGLDFERVMFAPGGNA